MLLHAVPGPVQNPVATNVTDGDTTAVMISWDPPSDSMIIVR